MQELDQLVNARPNFLHLGGLLDGIEIIPDVVDAAARGRDDVIEAGEIAHEQRLGVGAIGVEPAICHRLSATSLIARVIDIVAEPFEQLERCDADLWEEGVNVAGDEKPYQHSSLLGLHASNGARGANRLMVNRIGRWDRPSP